MRVFLLNSVSSFQTSTPFTPGAKMWSVSAWVIQIKKNRLMWGVNTFWSEMIGSARPRVKVVWLTLCLDLFRCKCNLYNMQTCARATSSSCFDLWPLCHHSALVEAVSTAQVFTSNETLLLWFGCPFTWQQCAGTPETANFGFKSVIFWNSNLLSSSVNWQVECMWMQWQH